MAGKAAHMFKFQTENFACNEEGVVSMKTRLNWNSLSKYRNQIYALSILWIFLFHADRCFPSLRIFKRVPRYIIKSGNIGVDIFLFLSGISMYYAMQRSKDTASFLKKRYAKILKIYLLFCVPYFILYYLSGTISLQSCIRQITFTKREGNTFWFLLCIFICYTIYPLLYKLISEKKERWIVGGVVCYIAGLAVFNWISPEAFGFDEIIITRFPIFVIGALAGKKVYNKEEISSGLTFSMLLFLLFAGDLQRYLYQIPFLGEEEVLLSRLFGSIQAVGAIFLFAILLPYLSGTKAAALLEKFGTITLEFYVVHMAIRRVLIQIVKVECTNKVEFLLFTAFWFFSTLIISLLLHRLLYGKRKEKIPAQAP